MKGPLLPLLLAGLLSTACHGSAKREASALAAAVDRFRRADNASKPAQAQTVAAVTCSDQRVCDAKQACLAAIDPTSRALALKDEVARRVVDIQDKRLSPTSPEAQALPGKLDEAEILLREGRTRMPVCEKRLADLVLSP
jgi:hypothetical protein